MPNEDGRAFHPECLDGKTMVVLFWDENEDGTDDVYSLQGVCQWDGKELSIPHTRGRLTIDPDWYDRIKEMPEDYLDIFGYAEYMMGLTVGPLPDDADLADYSPTGLNLNEANERT